MLKNIIMQWTYFYSNHLYEFFGILAIKAPISGLPCIVSDAIPKDIAATDDLVKFINLEEKNTVWVKNILKASKTQRKSQLNVIKSAKFNIE